MNRTIVGWGFVVVQAVLLLALVVLPSGDDWSTGGVVNAVGLAFLVAGFVIMAIAALVLGKSLTPTPVPVAKGQLKTSGLYRYVRHPIYTGVLAIAVALTLMSGSWLHLVIALVTVGFFNAKAQFEEQQLANHYPGYPAYAAKTPRFIPRPWAPARTG